MRSLNPRRGLAATDLIRPVLVDDTFSTCSFAKGARVAARGARGGLLLTLAALAALSAATPAAAQPPKRSDYFGGNQLPLQANFRVLKLTHVHPDTGFETWEEIDLDNEEIELGLKVRFDGTISTGGVTYWSWKIGNKYHSGPQVDVQMSTPGPVSVELSVYNASWELSTKQDTAAVGDGMQHLATAPYSGSNTEPQVSLQIGQHMWTITYPAGLAVANMSNPLSPGKLTFLSTVTLTRYSMAHYSGRLFIANGADGVRIYNASASAFQQVGHISATQLSGAADVVAISGNALYVGTTWPGKLHVFSLANPASPQFVSAINVSNGIANMAASGSDYLAIRSQQGNAVTIWDVRTPLSPFPLASGALPLVPPTNTSLSSSGEGAAAISNASVALVDVWQGSSGALQAALGGLIGNTSDEMVIQGNRLYQLDPFTQKLWKYDVTDSMQPYLMQQISLPTVTAMPVPWTASSGSFLMLEVTGSGFMTYAP